MLQGWAEVFIDAGLAIKAVILSFAQRQAFPPSPLSGDLLSREGSTLIHRETCNY